MSIVSIASTEDPVFKDLDYTQKICAALMNTPHYKKMGQEGIFAIVQKANSIGMNPLDALNGGMYFVGGKVEMQGQAMLALIRQHGHSVSLDPRSTNSHVIMHGKRKDNGDSWTVEFSIEDAKKAGIYRGQWEKYPKVMCQWRCVSMLGRFLFSDILKGVYVKGEINESACTDELLSKEDVLKIENISPKVSDNQAQDLEAILNECNDAYRKWFYNYIKEIYGAIKITDIPLDVYDKAKLAAVKAMDSNHAAQRECFKEQDQNQETVLQEV